MVWVIGRVCSVVLRRTVVGVDWRPVTYRTECSGCIGMTEAIPSGFHIHVHIITTITCKFFEMIGTIIWKPGLSMALKLESDFLNRALYVYMYVNQIFHLYLYATITTTSCKVLRIMRYVDTVYTHDVTKIDVFYRWDLVILRYTITAKTERKMIHFNLKNRYSLPLPEHALLYSYLQIVWENFVFLPINYYYLICFQIAKKLFVVIYY